MPQPVTLPAPASHRPFPERIEIDDTERAEQFAAFLRARALPPPTRFDWDPREGTSPPPWAHAYETANGKPFVGDAQGIEVPPVPDPAPAEGDAATPPAPPPTDDTGTLETGEAPADEAVEPAISADPAGETSSTSEPGDPDGVESSDGAAASFAAPFTETEPTFQPNTPRYGDVPDAWKWPIGPYQQDPEEFGGQWWKVNPFTGSEPWRPVAESAGSRPSEPAEEFLAVFGPRREARDFDGVTAYRAARGRWDQDLAYFKQSGIPEGFDPSKVERATNFFETWGMGRPAFYEGRHGWAVRFPDSGLPAFEANASTALEYSHLIVASFQTRQLLNGVDPAKRHPFVPPMLKAENV